ncbi:succinoglycan biosynthesis protein exoi [Mesorhizobium temperatum]|uniref:Succinoglycan biosynthesis protein exoi n=1 Tax=Mesorhizobium temperatum TaxID=241416 RepID=A0A271LPW1_9HYPH|nr:succinoglycan biosynthesis protein exoi [Mesorhizobium temperatum]
MPSRRLPRPLLGLIFLGVATLAAAVTQFAIQSTAGQQSTAGLQSTITNWTEPLLGPMKGRASVIDGDTVEIAGQRIRFNGIDAPESRQYCDDAKGFDYPCGRRAAQALDEFLAASRPLHCSFVDRDRYGRLVGNCNRADGRSVQKWLVEQGLALDWPRYSNGAFAAEQVSAKAAHRGVWQGRFDPPWDWRAANADKVETVSEQSTGFGLLGSGCNVKGNISVNSGEHIYHLPGQEYYDETVITPSKGERWFCSEAEARAAGWRKARR